MAGIFTHRGNFNNIEKFLRSIVGKDYRTIIERHCQDGITALSNATPVDSGLTASSWNYEIHGTGSDIEVIFTNSNVVDGLPVAILIQYGHATGTGGYIPGIDYINPAIQPIFDKMANDIWKVVTS